MGVNVLPSARHCDTVCACVKYSVCINFSVIKKEGWDGVGGGSLSHPGTPIKPVAVQDSNYLKQTNPTDLWGPCACFAKAAPTEGTAERVVELGHLKV